jgi:hypothetical protein
MAFQNMKQNLFFWVPTSKGLTRQDPDLIPKLVGISSMCFRDLFRINPEYASGFPRDIPSTGATKYLRGQQLIATLSEPALGNMIGESVAKVQKYPSE